MVGAVSVVVAILEAADTLEAAEAFEVVVLAARRTSVPERASLSERVPSMGVLRSSDQATGRWVRRRAEQQRLIGRKVAVSQMAIVPAKHRAGRLQSQRINDQ
jgi:hypothetical protein